MNTQDKTQQTQRLTLPLYNLGCSSGDALTVERILARQSGVIEVYANPATEVAYITYDPALTNEEQLTVVIKRAGFGPGEGKK
ncbi:MAG: heavy-metal-associated domain-containing protein [Anaerolinea sp.]|nr:heavy-metal-associated domain-containing protein [Anaerolinea sp.]